MRVTPLEIGRNFLGGLEDLNDRLNDINKQVSSGKKLTDLKDSPVGSAQLVALSEQAADVDQYQSNLNSGSYFLGMADSILNEVNNLTTAIFTKGSQAASGSTTNDARATLASEVRSLRAQLVALANSQVNGRYIFAGSKTDQAPFEVAADAVVYHGDSAVNAISVEDGLQVKQGVSGSAAFSSIFSTVDSLLSNLDDNNTSGIKSSLETFASALSQLNIARGEVGANLGILQELKTTLDARETSLTEQRSRVEDADMAQAVVQLSQVQSALQAAVSAGGSILQQSNLFDILG
jgi:flagellar hook-associated protein 3 FlgL